MAYGGGYFSSDEYNAVHGQYTPESILNSFQQKKNYTASPYDAILQHSLDFSRPPIQNIYGQAQQAAGTGNLFAQAQQGANVGNLFGQAPRPGVGGPSNANLFAQATQGGPPASPSWLATDQQKAGLLAATQFGVRPRLTMSANAIDNRDTGGGTDGTGGGPTFPTTPPVTPPGTTDQPDGGKPYIPGNKPPAQTPPATSSPVVVNPQTGKPYQVMKPPNVDQALWDTADRYVTSAAAKGADYQFLYSHPEYITEFQNWSIANDPNHVVDITDYLAHVHPDQPHQLSGRSGKDTMALFLSQHAGATAPGGPPNPNTNPQGGNPNVPAPPTAPAPPDYSGTPQLQTPSNYLDSLNRALAISQQQALTQGLRQFRSAAGATGLENTGAYGAGQQDLIANLASQFGQQRAQAMVASSEAERQRAYGYNQNALDRTLQQYGIDVGSYTSRFNTTTEAGVQMAAQQMQYDLGLKGIQLNKDQLAESIRQHTLDYNLGVGAQDLSRYGIDQGTMIELFKIMAQIGPDETFKKLFGPQAPPGFFPQVNP